MGRFVPPPMRACRIGSGGEFEGRRGVFSYVKRLAGYQGVDRVIFRGSKAQDPAGSCIRWFTPIR